MNDLSMNEMNEFPGEAAEAGHEETHSAAAESPSQAYESDLTSEVPAAPPRLPLSARKLAANRRNARKSTGPRTFIGKLNASRNNLQHGRRSGKSKTSLWVFYASMRELGEDPDEFSRLRQDLIESFEPQTAAEEMLVDDLAARRWERMRLERGQAALLARRIQQLEIARQRKSLEISQKISAQLPTAILKMGLIWDEDSPEKFQRLLEWLGQLKDLVEASVFDGAELFIGWIYGPNPSMRGALIKSLFMKLAEATPKAPAEPADVSLLRRELMAEISSVTQQYQLYLRQHVEITPTMRAECLVPTTNERWLSRELNRLDRQIERKTKLLLEEQTHRAKLDQDQ